MATEERTGLLKTVSDGARALLRGPRTEREQSKTIFNNFFFHIHSVRINPRTLELATTWGLGVVLASLFLILSATGILLMVYYSPSVERAYNSVKDIHYVVPGGLYVRNIHRWAAELMVLAVFLHMARVFYTAAYKGGRARNWIYGLVLFILTLAMSFTGYLLPWDQLAYWAITIGSNIAASPNELAQALGLPPAFHLGNLVRELLLGSSGIGQDALIRFYLLHVILLPLVLVILVGLHFWRIRKDGGLAHPDDPTITAGKGVRTSTPEAQPPAAAPTRTYGLMAIVRDRSPHTGKNPDGTLPSWPYLMRAELVLFMITLLVCVTLGFFFDAPLKEPANAAIPENPAKAPWYFLGIQEMVSYSAFMGGLLVPAIALIGLGLIPFLDREKETLGVWFSGAKGKKVALHSAIFAFVAAVASVAVPVNFGWLRTWFPDIPQLIIIFINPGSILLALYVAWSLVVLKKSASTRLSAIAIFTCFMIGFLVLTIVGTHFRGPNWDFFWSPADWPIH